MTETNKFVVLYDGACRFCRAAAALGSGLMPAGRFAWETLGMEKPGEMRLQTPDGRSYGGADALIRMAEEVWWMRPLWWIGKHEGGRTFLRRIYRWVADRRGCFDGRCQPRTKIGLGTFLFFSSCMVGIAWGAIHLPRWVTMWSIAFWVYVLAKWLTLRLAARPSDPLGRRSAYLALWVGMDAPAFLRGTSLTAPSARDWWAVVVRVLFGGMLTWAVARQCGHELLQGWVGLIGLILILHFGFFHALALAWRRAGIDARPIMDRPLAATSLAEFWGRRWNRGFTNLATRLLFQPIARRVGGRWALLAVFAFSGLVHELVISVPAGAGWGLPTAYFLLQGSGVLIEKTRLGQHLAGHTFTLLVTAGPLFWLFHPPFIREIALPMLRAFHAL